MLTSLGKLIFALLIILTVIAFLSPVIYRIRLICLGQPDRRFNKPIKRIINAFYKVFLQRCTLKKERLFTGFMHVFIFYGALTFDTMTINHTLEGFFKDFFLFGNTNFGLIFSFIVDLFAILVLVGVIFFIIRRFIIKPKAYLTSLLDSAIIYLFLIATTLSYMYFETFSIALHPDTERFSFLGGFLADMVQKSALSPNIILSHFNIAWWLHIVIVFAFISYVPHSKYFHMFLGPVNVLFNSEKAMSQLESLDIENSEIFGVEKATDYTWKNLLDAFTCVECGRCQDVCPAYASEKPLSPKLIITNLKNHLIDSGKVLLKKQREQIPSLMEETYQEDEIWTCTTCGACMYVCPFDIEHIPNIIGVRRSLTLMESKFPSELNSFFRNMETNSNPWGIGFANRADWTEGLDVKLLSENRDAEYLLWIGCAGSFDEEGKKISQAVVEILNQGGVNYAILGTEEKCCGDSVRRLGNEYLYQMMAEENLQLFKNYNVKKIIVICPHGYNTFKNEYPELLDLIPSFSAEEKEKLKNIEIIHHVEFIDKLVKEKKLHLTPKDNGPLTYHDSCYLGRHNEIIELPRKILSSINKNKFVELKNNKKHSFCCGAGGGLMWTEETIGDRINHLRTDEVINSQSEVVATSCPFCLTMLKDGLKDKDYTNIRVKDIAQLIAENIKT
ncbi:MAG: (Fe-S)-binding protein [Candidatus Aminicenantaceae bacterium]